MQIDIRSRFDNSLGFIDDVVQIHISSGWTVLCYGVWLIVFSLIEIRWNRLRLDTLWIKAPDLNSFLIWHPLKKDTEAITSGVSTFICLHQRIKHQRSFKSRRFSITIVNVMNPHKIRRRPLFVSFTNRNKKGSIYVFLFNNANSRIL